MPGTMRRLRAFVSPKKPWSPPALLQSPWPGRLLASHGQWCDWWHQVPCSASDAGLRDGKDRCCSNQRISLSRSSHNGSLDGCKANLGIPSAKAKVL